MQIITLYTQITDVNCQLLRVPFQIDDTRWDVVRTGDVYGLAKGHTEQVFAMLNKRTCHHLLQVEDGRSVRMQAFLTEAGSEDEDEPRTLSSTFQVDVSIYGRENLANEVGHILDAAEVFLQRPIVGVEGLKYYNPHYLHLQHSAEADLISENFWNANQPGQAVEEEAGREHLDFILNSLSHQSLLREHVADRRIKSALLPWVSFSYLAQVANSGATC